jgi:hypothetical protein
MKGMLWCSMASNGFILENCVSAVRCEICAINIEGRAGTPVRLSLYDVAEKHVPAV